MIRLRQTTVPCAAALLRPPETKRNETTDRSIDRFDRRRVNSLKECVDLRESEVYLMREVKAI